MKPDDDINKLRFTLCQYGEHKLQRVGVWQPSLSDQSRQSPEPDQASYWIIFIHGGGWRDPRNTYEDFLPSIKCMVGSPDLSDSSIRGFASIDYRLSPHPSFPQDQAKTPASDLRNAQHPDHLHDVRSAISYLNEEFAIGQEYILVGHSAGATLAYQLLMGRDAVPRCPLPPAPFPRAVIGISGIYHIPGLVTRHEGMYGGIYRTFITDAFGQDESGWVTASPSCFPGKFLWQGGKLAVLAWSPEDTMIDRPELTAMTEKLEHDETPMLVRDALYGDHEVVWETGEQLPPLVKEVIQYLRTS